MLKKINEIISEVSWQQNDAGFWTSATFGFGLLDALKFIEISERWPSVIGEQRHCKLDWPPKNTPYSKLTLVNLVNNHDAI